MSRLIAGRWVLFRCLVTLLLVSLAAAAPEVSDRTERRAFYTAPPTVPHELDGLENGDCLTCHEDVLDLGDQVSAPTPHPEYFNCLQCHVGTAPLPIAETTPDVASDWKGLAEPTLIERANPKAPPSIPHRLFLRDRCLSCHHPDHPNPAQRTSHPERSNCQQCHVADQEREF
ncbi:MAG: hypothetical protein JSU96_02550 [Acidobacteriota bacterium]|nr:MAG: hypothetical protein JSU96_02550 [Acidobacteriota bacterium]